MASTGGSHDRHDDQHADDHDAFVTAEEITKLRDLCRGEDEPPLGAYVDRCLEHALTVLTPFYPGQDNGDDDCEVRLFKQSWPNTACGWPGIAGQAFTSAYTVVVLGPHGDAVVYLGKPAYYLNYQPDVAVAERERFHEALNACRMPAVRDCAKVGCKRFP